MKRNLSLCLLLCLFASVAWSQTRRVSGRVISDSTKQPLSGVSVAVKGGNSGAATDTQGQFSITIPENGNPVLVFSSVGYTAKEVAIGKKSNVDVTMTTSTNALDDVVVIGYGSVRKRDLTGSVVSLRKEQITSTPVTNVLETMQGKVSGLDLVRSSGETGAAMNFTIRGNRSSNASNQPLVLVDGIPYGSYIDIILHAA